MPSKRSVGVVSNEVVVVEDTREFSADVYEVPVRLQLRNVLSVPIAKDKRGYEC